jgi:hypothetical protein
MDVYYKKSLGNSSDLTEEAPQLQKENQELRGALIGENLGGAWE